MFMRPVFWRGMWGQHSLQHVGHVAPYRANGYELHHIEDHCGGVGGCAMELSDAAHLCVPLRQDVRAMRLKAGKRQGIEVPANNKGNKTN